MSCNHVQDDEFHSISKGDIHQGTDGVAEAVGHSLGRMAEQAGERDDGDGIHGKDHTRAYAGHEVDGDADGDKDQQDIDPAVEDDLLEDQEEAPEDIGLVLAPVLSRVCVCVCVCVCPIF